jgi:UDP-N-acetylglucosamine transferase subunit ALG13
VTISGKIPSLSSGDRICISEVIQWGNLDIRNLEISDYLLKQIPGDNYGSFSKLLSINFQDCTSLEYIPENLFQYANNLNHFESTFKGCSSLKEIPEDVQILWQSGKFYDSEAKMALSEAGEVAVKQSAFITRMDLAYAAADLVISRAGASSISELCLLGKPSILVPSPNVAEDHQTKNAMALSTKDAAILVPDVEANMILMQQAFKIVANDVKLKNLSENIKSLAQKDSASRIADIVIKIANKKENE